LSLGRLQERLFVPSGGGKSSAGGGGGGGGGLARGHFRELKEEFFPLSLSLPRAGRRKLRLLLGAKPSHRIVVETEQRKTSEEESPSAAAAAAASTRDQYRNAV